MKLLSKTKALARLKRIVSNFKSEISNFERRAKDCATCEVKGSCCMDAHFVNVHISRLDAVAINKVIDEMPRKTAGAVRRQIEAAIAKYDLTAEGDTYSQTFACPLFDKTVGCLVHHVAKPAACIAHACYESSADLPPDALLVATERRIEPLNTQAFGRPQPWLPLPLALKKNERQNQLRILNY